MSEDKRLFYPRKSRPQVVEYSHEEPIRGRIVFKGDFTPKPLTIGRHAEGGERVPDYVELDGRRFTEDGIDLIEHYEDGRCVAVDLDGARYVRERTCDMVLTYRGFPCNDYECTACGKKHCAERASEHCPRCGARRVRVVDSEGRELTLSGERDGR